MKIGITGATGQLGNIVVAKLKERTNTENLVALVRTPAKAENLAVSARSFDYSKPETLAENLKGIDTLLLISGSEIGQRETQHKNVIDAAKTAGVQWIVYTSLLHADTSSLSLAQEHLATESMLKNSGITYTILRNGWYTENYTGTLKDSIKAGGLIGSAGAGKIASATREDFAEAAAVVLTTENHANKVYELSGDTAYTLDGLAEEVSKQTGKDIKYQNLTEEKYADILTNIGLPEGLATAIASWDVGASKNDLYDEGNTLSTLLNRPTTPLNKAVEAALV